jgi:hypothetical protein
MAIRAIVFDIGGVLEIMPRTGWVEKWEARLHLNPGNSGSVRGGTTRGVWGNYRQRKWNKMSPRAWG